MSILEKLKSQTEQLSELIFEWTFKILLQLTFLRISMITDRDLFQLFLYMNWFSMIFPIDFFRKIITTILSCFLTSCPNKNDWHVFPKCLFYKNLNRKLGNCVTYHLNVQIQDALRISMITDRNLFQLFLIWIGSVRSSKLIFSEKS